MKRRIQNENTSEGAPSPKKQKLEEGKTEKAQESPKRCNVPEIPKKELKKEVYFCSENIWLPFSVRKLPFCEVIGTIFFHA